jgi:undecaprenyl pyrophosphate phosphatase UppP
MKTLLIIAVIAAIIAITAIKEDRAEAYFRGFQMFCFTIAICSIFMWITGKLRQRNMRRMREDHEIIWSKN